MSTGVGDQLAHDVLARYGTEAAKLMGPHAAQQLLDASRPRPTSVGEWLLEPRREGSYLAGTRALADGWNMPDSQGYVAYINHGVTRAQLPALIGWLTALLAAQRDETADRDAWGAHQQDCLTCPADECCDGYELHEQVKAWDEVTR